MLTNILQYKLDMSIFGYATIDIEKAKIELSNAYYHPDSGVMNRIKKLILDIPNNEFSKYIEELIKL